MGSYDDDLRFAHVLADAADDITTQRFRALDLRIETKPDLTPVSDADQATEDSLRNILRRSRPRDAVLGEESGPGPAAVRGRWCSTSIDATKNYVRGVPVWATLIGLMDGDQVVTGVVTAPALGRRWWAAAGGGAWSLPVAHQGLALPGLPGQLAWRRFTVILRDRRLGQGRAAERSSSG